jgi:predicted nucleic acid-binding protein
MITAITTPIPEVAATHDDNLVIATAESAGVPFLVTGDAELLPFRQYRTAVQKNAEHRGLLRRAAPA